MDPIRKALDLASGNKSAGIKREVPRATQEPAPELVPNHIVPGYSPAVPNEFHVKQFELNLAHLEANRIVAHSRSNQPSRSFDMLRTQVLQSMDQKSWQTLAVTSPTPGCGKTLTSINLALSIARQSENSVLLVDMDFEKPKVADCLGLPHGPGLLSVLNRKAAIESALVQASVGNTQLTVLPCEISTTHSSEFMTSRAMSAFLQQIKNEDRSRIIILDLPPILSGDNVISILPQIDCVLLVVAVGTTTAAEIKETNKHLKTSSVVRVVLNKSADNGPNYYY